MSKARLALIWTRIDYVYHVGFRFALPDLQYNTRQSTRNLTTLDLQGTFHLLLKQKPLREDTLIYLGSSQHLPYILALLLV